MPHPAMFTSKCCRKNKERTRQQLSNRRHHRFVSPFCFIGWRSLLDVLSGEKSRQKGVDSLNLHTNKTK